MVVNKYLKSFKLTRNNKYRMQKRKKKNKKKYN